MLYFCIDVFPCPGGLRVWYAIWSVREIIIYKSLNAFFSPTKVFENTINSFITLGRIKKMYPYKSLWFTVLDIGFYIGTFSQTPVPQRHFVRSLKSAPNPGTCALALGLSKRNQTMTTTNFFQSSSWTESFINYPDRSSVIRGFANDNEISDWNGKKTVYNT